MYLLFDIGGTKLRVGLSSDLRSIDHMAIFPTPETVDEAVQLMHAHVLHHSSGAQLKGVGGGVAGALSHDRKVMIKSPNNPSWDNQPLQEKMEQVFQAPVFLENDAAVIGLGEAHTGPGMGQKIVVYITISTGVGGARIVDGKIDPSFFGSEPGHQIISIGEKDDGSPVFGYLEDFISGGSLRKAFGKEPHEITDQQVWDDVAFFLAIGLNNVIVHWSPDMIILGGGVMKHIDLDKVRKYVKDVMRIYPELPQIEQAKIDDFGGLYGALEFLKQKTNTDIKD